MISAPGIDDEEPIRIELPQDDHDHTGTRAFDAILATPDPDKEPEPQRAPKSKQEPEPDTGLHPASELLAALMGQSKPGSDTGKSSSRNDWQQVSKQKSGVVPGPWSVNRIEAAPQVGPAELSHDPAGSGGATGTLPTIKDLEPPERLKVVLGRKLGRGPTGRTLDGALGGRASAVKVVTSALASHPDLVKQMTERLQASMAIIHPCVVSVFVVYKKMKSGKQRTFIFFEKVKGPTLHELLRIAAAPPSPEVASTWVRDIARALRAAEEEGLAHGDVRPKKVFIDENNQACLADFGMAEVSCLMAGYGRYGLRFGHPAYLAPEVVQERTATPSIKTDIYALGILYYQLLSGRLPFQADDPQELLRKHLTSPIPPPPNVDDIPQVVAELVLRMTCKDPAGRPDSALELIQALDACPRDRPAGTQGDSMKTMELPHP